MGTKPGSLPGRRNEANRRLPVSGKPAARLESSLLPPGGDSLKYFVGI